MPLSVVIPEHFTSNREPNRNVFPICYHFKDIRRRNVLVQLTSSKSKWLWTSYLEWLRSDLNISIKRSLSTSYLQVIAIFFLYVTVCEIIAMTSIRIFDLENEGKGSWKFGWKWTDALTLSACKIYVTKFALLGSAVCSGWYFMSDVRTHIMYDSVITDRFRWNCIERNWNIQ